jgi:wobble nucleotide-excising tRNase
MQQTYHSLHDWTKSLFEKLGKMVLAIHDQNIDKVHSYLKNINFLIKALDNKIKITTEIDRINDLKILREQVIYLQYFANVTLSDTNNFRTV